MKLLLDLFNHLLLCRCRWHTRVIFVVAQIHMSMRTDTFVLMRKIDTDRLLMIIIIIHQMLQFSVFNNCINTSRCM